jgi:hypothetical protein
MTKNVVMRGRLLLRINLRGFSNPSKQIVKLEKRPVVIAKFLILCLPIAQSPACRPSGLSKKLVTRPIALAPARPAGVLLRMLPDVPMITLKVRPSDIPQPEGALKNAPTQTSSCRTLWAPTAKESELLPVAAEASTSLAAALCADG